MTTTIQKLAATLAISALALSGVNRASADADTPPLANGPGTFFIIPHTHWEGAVFKTREEYLEMGLTHILTAVRLLREHPNYRFALDQVAYFRPFLERYPAEAVDFKKFVTEGRLEIVGGLNVMPDDNMPSGESFVRQMLYAKQYCREALGTEVKTAWLIDTFGHHAQLPQILHLGGFETFWFSRGIEDHATMPTEFLWQGIDGTRLKSFWLPFMYGNFDFPPKDFPGFNKYARDRYNDLESHVHGPVRIGFNGADVTDPELLVPDQVNQFNAQPDKPFALRLAVPREVQAALAGQTNLPVVTGERNPLFQGVYSTRIELKQRMREMERLLTTAEKFGALANWLGSRTDDKMTERAWDPVTFNVTHDLASGVMTDLVYADTVRGYDFAQRLTGELIETRLNNILARVNTAGEGIPLVVCNTLGWPRTDVANGDVGFAAGGIVDFDVVDSTGTVLPAQTTEEERFADGGLRRIKFAFIARDVPAMGYSVYHVIPRKSSGASKHPVDDHGSGVLENSFYRANFDLKNGTLTSLRRKEGDWESISGPANVVAVEPDHGDVWELYHNLNGSQRQITKRPLPVPTRSQAQLSSDASSTNGLVRRGPVFSEMEVTSALGTNVLTTLARIYQDVSRVDFETRILNRDRFVRYRMLVPTTVTKGQNFQEIPFGAIERPMTQEFPAQNWIDCGDGTNGIALLNCGNPGNNVSDGTMMLSLMRSTRIESYGIGGGFEGQSSDSALELNKELTLRYALMPHAGSWRDAGAYRAGLEFNNPLVVRKAAPHGGSLPARWGFLKVSAPNVVFTALKPSHDGFAVVRVYEASGKATSGVKLKFNAKVVSASEANLIEDTLGQVRTKQNTLEFDLHPFEIKTFKVRLEPAKPEKGA